MAAEENGFLEYLTLQGGEPELLTKSELIATVREAGYRLSDRQLTFYSTENLLPRSVRAGSRSGVYPAVVRELMVWILGEREQGTSLEALRELLPVWKFLIRASRGSHLDLAELEYVARQHVTSVEASMSVPRVVAQVLHRSCAKCLNKTVITYKDGTTKNISDPEATIGFAIARTPDDDDSGTPQRPRWYATTRLSLGTTMAPSQDVTTVLLGLKPNVALPPDPDVATRDGDHDDKEVGDKLTR